MKWTILRETFHEGEAPSWEPTGETFEGDIRAVNDWLHALQAEHGGCFAAEAEPPAD